MLNKCLRIGIILILLVPTLSLFSQSKSQSVDIIMGKEQISSIGEDNESAQQQINKPVQENENLQTSVKEMKLEIEEIKVLTDEVRTRKAEVYAILNKLADKEGKVKAQKSYDNATKLLKDLIAKQGEMDGSLKNAIQKRAQNIKKINAHKDMIDCQIVPSKTPQTRSQAVSLAYSLYT